MHSATNLYLFSILPLVGHPFLFFASNNQKTSGEAHLSNFSMTPVQINFLFSAVRRLPKQLISFNNMLGHYLNMPYTKAGDETMVCEQGERTFERTEEVKMEIKGILSYIVIIGLVAAVVLTAAIRPDYTLNMQPAKNVLTVSGESTITTSPDKAEIYLNVEKKAETADGARVLNSEASNAVIAALKADGLKKEDIETSSFSIYPEQRYDEDTQEYITTGYVVRHVIKATTSKAEESGQLIDIAIKAGANSVENVNFGLTTEKKQVVDKDALAKATELAKARAESMADAAGVKLNKLASVEGGSSYMPYIYYGARMEMASSAKDAGTSIMPQALEVRATATLVYEIE